jgi:hypothetical protein
MAYVSQSIVRGGDGCASAFWCTSLVRLHVLAALVAFGCDSSLISEGPVAVCTESGEQCQLSKGPLGVCEAVPCLAGASAPCFKCTSQH